MDDHDVGEVATAGLDTSRRHGGARPAPIALPEPPQQVAGRPVGGARQRTGRPLPGKRSWARRPLRWVIGALVVLAIVAVVAWRALPTRVSVTTVARRDVARTLVLTGRVRPPARPRLGASVSGTVRQVFVREGDHVSRGQLLVRLDDAQPAAAVAQTRAALATVEAQTRSTADQADLAFQQANRNLDRARALHAQGAISARDLEAAERSAADARSQLDAARARTAAGGATRLAEVARARAAVTEAEARLALTRVTAPAPATVLSRAVELGDAVVAGQVLLELSLDGPTELAAYPREENVADLKIGASALASADAYPGRTFVAQVSWLAPVVDRTQGTVETRFAVPDPPDYLRADMTVSINVEVERRADALVVSLDLVGDAKSAAPWVVVERAGRATRQRVRLGIVGDREVEILGGLAVGDRVLPAEIESGRRVRVTGTASGAPGARIGPER
jgi:HlyD family secretion protein